jgi:hypothetical protein
MLKTGFLPGPRRLGARVGRLRLGSALALTAAGALAVQSFGGSDGSVAHAQAPGTTAANPGANPGPRAPTLRLLTQGQYQNAILGIFGPDIAVKVRFAPLQRVDGLLAVGASTAVMTGGGIDPLEATARGVAEQVVSPERRGYLISCKPANARAADEACAREFLSTAGRLLYRRPLGQREIGDLVGIAGKAADSGKDFYAGLGNALAGMLVSPQFLYIWEQQEADPAATGASRLDGYSKAARLSFLLWNTGPDEDLLKAAERGDLHTAAGLQRQVDRMLGSPLFKDGVRAFFDDFLVNETFETLSKDQHFYPAVTIKAVAEAREQMLRTVVDHLVDRRGDYRDLFTTRRTFMSSDLAVLYRVPLDTGSQGWVPYQFPAGDPRAGIQSQIGFLAKYAHPARSSATRRGRAVREVLLCQHVPDPPPNVDFSNFEDPAGEFKTARDRLTAHNANPVCAGCHKITDPIGLTLENFDGAGQFRLAEGGVPINASGSLDGITYSDAAGLGLALRNNASLKSCIVNRLYAYSIGQKVTPDEEPLLERYQAAFEKRGYRFDGMLRAIILDPGFFSVRPLVATQTAFNTASGAARKGAFHAH